MGLGHRSTSTTPELVGVEMLSASEFTVGSIGHATPLSLVLPRHEHEETILIAQCQGGPAAFFLSEGQRFKWFESSGNNHWHGLIVPNVRIEVDETTVFDPSRIEARAGTAIRRGPQLVAQAKGPRAFSGLDPIILEDALEETSGESAGFSRWQIVIGTAEQKRVLHTVIVG